MSGETFRTPLAKTTIPKNTETGYYKKKSLNKVILPLNKELEKKKFY